MSLMIVEDCISCDVCVTECPNEAIAQGADHYVISSAKCTECVGHFDTQQCREVCPVDCIVEDPSNVESKDTLMEKYQKLKAA